MEPLKDWYRYVDSVSRPSRRITGEEPEPAAWRPWLGAADAEDGPEEVVGPCDVPVLDLSSTVGRLPEALLPGGPEFQDETIDDELEPISQFTIPEFHPPEFAVEIPRFLMLGGSPPEPEPATEVPDSPGDRRIIEAERELAEAGAKGGAAAPAPAEEAAPEEPLPSLSPEPTWDEDGPRPTRHWDLLSQIRTREVAQNSYKKTFEETREQLLQRLMDPPLTLEETARLLGVCPTTVRRYTNKGLLRHFRTQGNQRRFRLSDVAEFLNSRADEIEADAQADRAAGLQ